MAFAIYKPGQGKYSRTTAGVLLGLTAAYGASALKGTLADAGVMFTVAGQQFSYAQVVPMLVFILLAAAIAWGLNFPRFADFLIETEIEMSRVIWPTKRTVISSSIVVIVTVVVMSVLLYWVDWLFLKGLTAIGLF